MMLRSGRLSPETEAVLFLITVGLIVLFFLATELSVRRDKRRLRKFYEQNEYRAVGTIISARPVTSKTGLACWELKVRYRDVNDREETASLTTCDPAAAQRTEVELALLQPRALPAETMSERFDRMNAHEREKMSIEEHRALLHELLDEKETEARSIRRVRQTLGLEPRRVRLWEERYETVEEHEWKRQQQNRSLRIALGLLGVVAVVGVLIVWTAEK